MQRQVPQVVGLTGADFDFHYFDTALFFWYDTNATLEQTDIEMENFL